MGKRKVENCICTSGSRCHHGRPYAERDHRLCTSCVEKWFSFHLPHRIAEVREQRAAETVCIVMRSLFQFLGLGSCWNPSAGRYQLKKEEHYRASPRVYRSCGCKGCSSTKVTYEIQASNLIDNGRCSVQDVLGDCKGGSDEEFIARFIEGVHGGTAHLTWGINHRDEEPVWDIDGADGNAKIRRLLFSLLEKHVYVPTGREFPAG